MHVSAIEEKAGISRHRVSQIRELFKTVGAHVRHDSTQKDVIRRKKQ